MFLVQALNGVFDWFWEHLHHYTLLSVIDWAKYFVLGSIGFDLEHWVCQFFDLAGDPLDIVAIVFTGCY